MHAGFELHTFYLDTAMRFMAVAIHNNIIVNFSILSHIIKILFGDLKLVFKQCNGSLMYKNQHL